MKLHHRIAVLILGMLCSAAVVAGTAADAVTVSDPYVRAMPPGQPNSLAFMGITNGSDQDFTLVGAEGSVSKVLELHTHIMSDGMMQMKRIDKIDLPAGKTVMLESGGLHVMLIGLNQDLNPGDTVSLTLVFNDGSKKQLDVPVRKMEMSMKKGDDKPMQMKH
jgi:periplasmic copper chaperone A